MKTQEPITHTWLVNRGYNIAQAARKIGRSAAHVNMVIHGKRESIAALNALRALPERRFEPREAITRAATAQEARAPRVRIGCGCALLLLLLADLTLRAFCHIFTIIFNS